MGHGAALQLGVHQPVLASPEAEVVQQCHGLSIYESPLRHHPDRRIGAFSRPCSAHFRQSEENRLRAFTLSRYPQDPKGATVREDTIHA